MSDKLITSIDLEKTVIAALLQHGNKVYAEVASVLTPEDFAALTAHKIFYTIIQKRLESTKDVSAALITEEIKNLGIKFKELEDVFSYLTEALGLLQITIKGGIEAVKELKKITVAREICLTASRINEKVRKSLNLTAQEIIDLADEEYNSRISTYYSNGEAIDLFDGLEEEIELRGNNPNSNNYLMGPHSKLNELYGSLVRPGNLTTICARSGSFKTTFLLHYGVQLALTHNIPIIHADFGEMSAEELQFRQAAALSGVPLHMVEQGTFRQNEETTKLVRSMYPTLKKLKGLYYYLPVGGKNSAQILGMFRRLYYSKVGRGNKTAIIFDYWKSYNDDYQSKSEWERFGKLTQEFKDFISNEIPIGILAGLQGNREGIVTNKKSNEINDHEGIASGGDRIVFHSSHFFILRKKTLDQLAAENNKFGNCMMQNIAKCRHLGTNINDALNPVKMPDGSFRSNYINFAINNFNVVEMGDLASTKHLLSQLDITDKDPHADTTLTL